jgi:hypothetical protein
VTEQYKLVLYYSIVCTNAALCHIKYVQVGATDEQTAGHGGGESGDADQQQLDPPASCKRPGTQALTRVLPSGSE